MDAIIGLLIRVAILGIVLNSAGDILTKIANLPLVNFMPLSEVEERLPTLLITSAPAWNAVNASLRGLNIAATLEVTEANIAHWEGLQSKISGRKPEIVYAVGGGLVADAAKYIAVHLDLPLVVVPTALSVDAFFTAASGIRQGGCVYYLPTRVADSVILDLDVIAAAPAWIRAAGITDVLSIATGSWDWQFAHQRHQNPPGMEFIPWIYANAQSILHSALDCAEAAGRGDKDGLKTLYDCLAMEVQLCNQAGHSRPEEGSEHYFAYYVENLTGHGLLHGELVGPGILRMAKLQGQATAPLEAALKACHIPLDRIPEPAIQRTLKGLPFYVRMHNLPYGIAHALR